MIAPPDDIPVPIHEGCAQQASRKNPGLEPQVISVLVIKGLSSLMVKYTPPDSGCACEWAGYVIPRKPANKKHTAEPKASEITRLGKVQDPSVLTFLIRQCFLYTCAYMICVPEHRVKYTTGPRDELMLGRFTKSIVTEY